MNSKFFRIFLNYRQTISSWWQWLPSQNDEGTKCCSELAGEEDVWPTDHSESFGDGTRVLEILFTQAEPERMTIVVSNRENIASLNTLFEFVTERLYTNSGEKFPLDSTSFVVADAIK